MFCLAHELVPENDQEVFVKMVLEALQHIHEGSVARFRLKDLFYSKHEKKPNPIKGLEGMYLLKRLSEVI